MDSPGPLSFFLFFFMAHTAGMEDPPQNFTCILGSSVDLCLPVPGVGDLTHILLWSASRKKGLALWAPEEPLYVVSPLYSGRITLAEGRTFRIQNLKQADAGIYEVLMRSPGSANSLLLMENTLSVLNISIAKGPQGNHSCSLDLSCEPHVGAPSGRAGHLLLLGYGAAKAILTPPPLFFLYWCCFRRASGRKARRTVSLPRTPSPPVVFSEVEERAPYQE